MNCQIVSTVCTTLATMALKLEKVASKLLTKQARHIGRWSHGHTRSVRQETQGIMKREHVSLQGKLARKHVSTQDTLAREHIRGHLKSTFVMQGEGFQAYLYVRSVKKIAWFSNSRQSSFWKVAWQLLNVFCFEPSPPHKGVFLLKRRRHFVFILLFFMNM